MGNMGFRDKNITPKVKEEELSVSDVSISTKISIPNQKRDDDIAEDQITIIELFMNPSQDICILIMKEKTFTGDFQPKYHIHIYHYDVPQNRFMIVLDHTVPMQQIDKAIYNPHHNLILLYNTLRDVEDDEHKFYLFKFEYMTTNNPKLGMNGYDMTRMLHPHINFFGKCRYATFLKKATEILFVFEKGYFILLSRDESTRHYDHINYFSTRGSYKYLGDSIDRNSLSNEQSPDPVPLSATAPAPSTTPRKRKRGYRLIMVSVHEKRDRIAWIESEYNHYYLQIVCLRAILDHKRKISESHEYYSEDTPSDPRSRNNHQYQYSGSQSITGITASGLSPVPPVPPSPSTPKSTFFPSTPSASSRLYKLDRNGSNGFFHGQILQKQAKQQQQQAQQQPPKQGRYAPVIKISPIQLDLQRYLVVSRLIFANQKEMSTIRPRFADEYDLESRKLLLEPFHAPSTDDYGACCSNTKCLGVVRKRSESTGQMRKLTAEQQEDEAKYVLDTFFGINPNSIVLQFNRDGDKILFQSTGPMLHHEYSSISHGDQYSGNLNDFGSLHVIDVSTAHSIWSLGSSSKDTGCGWFNNFLCVLPSSKSASGMAASTAIYDPHQRARSRSVPSVLRQRSRRISKIGDDHPSRRTRRKHSHLQLFGFISETAIAEAVHDLEIMSWDLCLLLAMYCGGMREYRMLSLTKYEGKGKGVIHSVNNIKFIQNEILSIWNNSNHVFERNRKQRRDWLIIAMKEYRNAVRYIDIVFYDAKRIAMHQRDMFIPYLNDDGLICRNLLSTDDHKFDSLYYADD